MTFETRFKPGDIISNDELRDEFKCSSQGVMRIVKKTNTLILIADYTLELNTDKWKDDVLHYTGMSMLKDQKLSSQNKILAESYMNYVGIHLFEVFNKGRYTYKGMVELADAPYKDMQKDDEKNDRIVWMFPLKVIEG